MNLYGDGAAFWITEDPFVPGDTFGRSGGFTGLGVFFDTYDNAPGTHEHKHPYIAAVVSTGDRPLSEADLETDASKPLISDETDPAHAVAFAHGGCHARIRQFGREAKVTSLKVRYSHQEKSLHASVLLTANRGEMSTMPEEAWQSCFTLYDIAFPEPVYLGVSASTGQLTDYHDVLAMQVHSAGADAEDVRAAAALPAEDAATSEIDSTPSDPEDAAPAAAAAASSTGEVPASMGDAGSATNAADGLVQQLEASIAALQAQVQDLSSSMHRKIDEGLANAAGMREPPKPGRGTPPGDEETYATARDMAKIQSTLQQATQRADDAAQGAARTASAASEASSQAAQQARVLQQEVRELQQQLSRVEAQLANSGSSSLATGLAVVGAVAGLVALVMHFKGGSRDKFHLP